MCSPSPTHTGPVMQRATKQNIMETTVSSQFRCSHTERAAAAEAMEEIPVFRSMTHHASCVDGGGMAHSHL